MMQSGAKSTLELGFPLQDMPGEDSAGQLVLL